MTTNRAILLVEDNKDDVFLMQRALQSARIVNPLIVVETGQEAMDYLSGAGKFADRDSYPMPAVVFLDLACFWPRGARLDPAPERIGGAGGDRAHVVPRSQRFKPELCARGKLVSR